MDDDRRDAREPVAVEAEQQQACLGRDEDAHLVVERGAARASQRVADEPEDEVMQACTLGVIELAPLGETRCSRSCQFSGIFHSAPEPPAPAPHGDVA